MFAHNWIYWKVELLQHVNMKCNDKFYWYVKSSPLWLPSVQTLYYISTHPFFTTCKHDHYKVISQGNEKFVAYT